MKNMERCPTDNKELFRPSFIPVPDQEKNKSFALPYAQFTLSMRNIRANLK